MSAEHALCLTCTSRGTKPVRENAILCHSGPVGIETPMHTRCARYRPADHAEPEPVQCSICTHALTQYYTDISAEEQTLDAVRCELKRKIRHPGTNCPDFTKGAAQ